MKKRIALALLLALSVLSACGNQPRQAAGAGQAAAGIAGWAADSPAMQSIVSFVTALADENSPGFIPEEALIK